MKKKISQIITYSVLCVVVLGLILCSILKINFRPQMDLPLATDGDKIQISLAGTSKIESSDENIDYEKFVGKFDDAFKLSILYSVFSGKIGSELVITETKEGPSFNGFKVQFIYNDLQTIKKDGKDLTIADNSSTPIQFNTIVFDVAQDKGLTDVNLYFYKNGDKNYYKVTTNANFDELYNYILDIPMFGE